MKNQKPSIARSARVLAIMRSTAFFRVFFCVFIFESIWVTFSGAYSMSYDEFFHYGIIKLYSHQWSPFFAHQPHGANMYGALTRDPSYLYHYLMSFPLRLYGHFFHGLMAQVVFLRIIDIIFFALGLLVFRKVFKRAGFSSLVSNLGLLFLTVLPMTSFLAAQVNYDDLLFLLTAVSLWLTLEVGEAIRLQRRLPLLRILLLGGVGMLASLVKFAYLPILLALILYLGIAVKQTFGLRAASLAAAIRLGSTGLKSFKSLLLVVFFLLSLCLFVERYGLNMVRYHTPTPECDQLLTKQECKSYDVYARNNSFVEEGLPAQLHVKNKLSYPVTWFHGMVRSLFFTVSNRENDYATGDPLPLAYTAGWIAAIGGTALLFVRSRSLWRRGHVYQLFLLVSFTYIVVLFGTNLLDYLHLGIPVATQGRYLVQVLPLLLVMILDESQSFFRRFRLRYGLATLGVFLVLLVQGGGFLPFILRSSDTWMWQNPVSVNVNHVTRSLLWNAVIR